VEKKNSVQPQVCGPRELIVKRDLATENAFNMIVGRAKEKGMKVNVTKTQMLLISDATSFDSQAYIQCEDGGEVRSEKGGLKLLGFCIDGSPTVRAQVASIKEKVRRRLWVLRHLKTFGFSSEELVMVYQSQIRSVIEYCSVVYHGMLTGEQSDSLERLQYQALKCIYGYGESYRALREKTGLETLQERRLKAVDRFTAKCLAGSYAHWFPLNQGVRETRGKKKYIEYFVRCDRLRNTLLFYMRRRLNDLENKA
jgi:hypothetical protein